MLIETIILKLCQLAQDRKWGSDHDFFQYDDYIIYIDRHKIKKYEEVYKNLIFAGKFKLNVIMGVVDTWLVECIRNNIPSAKDYNIFT